MTFMRHEATMSTLSVNYESDTASEERYAPCKPFQYPAMDPPTGN